MPGGHMLNPAAPEFVPQKFRSKDEEKLTCLFCITPPVPTTLCSLKASSAHSCTTTLQDLPDGVLSTILGLLDVASLGSCLLLCKRLPVLVKNAPVRLAVSRAQFAEGQAALQLAPAEQVRSRLHSMCATLHGVRELDLSSSPLEDSDVLHALSELQRLEVLQLSACQKVTRDLITRAMQWGLLSRLTHLGLQRCFQLDSCALSSLLSATSQAESKLSVLLLSHLILAKWPCTTSNKDHNSSSQPPLPCAPLDQTFRQLDQGALSTWPQLQGSSVRVLGLHNCLGVSPLALDTISTACPNLQILLLGGCTFSNACLRAPGSCVPLHVVHAAAVAALGEAAGRLPQLLVLELSHAPAGLLRALAAKLAVDHARVRVVDLCADSGIEVMTSILYAGHASVERRQLQLAVEAAVNCSSSTRHTPLHLAAAHNSLYSIQALLAMGARVDPADRSNATPLFSACEEGHADAVAALLAAGADVGKCNASGEAPLYIAALKGRERCVEVLLTHLLAHNLPWMDKELYGDHWTPLMAAAVADRVSIVQRILDAAGPHARKLARHTNRTGSTAVHVAARRGCEPVLKQLLHAAGGAVASKRDHRCKTPIQVAEREGKWNAVALLRKAVKAS